MGRNRRTLGEGRKDQLFLHQTHALDHQYKPGAIQVETQLPRVSMNPGRFTNPIWTKPCG